MANESGNTTTEELLPSGLREVEIPPPSVERRNQNSSGSDEELLDFSPNDPANPRNWSSFQKWKIIIPITLIDLTVSWGASGYSPATTKFIEDFGVSQEVGTLGLSLYVLGLAFGPMSLAPLSEYFGRSPIYIASYGVFLLFLLGTALVKTLAGFLVLRFFSGLFAAVTIANFGGTIADLYLPHETGFAMSIFLWAATCGSPSGFLIFSFVAATRPWRDVFWALLGILSGFYILLLLTLQETRHSVLLSRRSKATSTSTITTTAHPPNTNTTHDSSQLPKTQKLKNVARNLFTKALSRPFRFLSTEAIVIFAALYNGYLYGLSFLFNGAFTLVFGTAAGYNFPPITLGLSFLGIIIGISIGPFTNLIQERHYRRLVHENNGKLIPEARVQMSQIAAVVFPISLFWFAWTTYKSVHWIVPIIASAFWGWSFYTLILMTYTYTEDSYGQFSASALAGIGLVRNVAGAGFPLFGRQLFVNLGFQWGGSVLAFLAVVLVPIPFILVRYGRRLRERSPWARVHMDEVAEGHGDVRDGDRVA